MLFWRGWTYSTRVMDMCDGAENFLRPSMCDGAENFLRPSMCDGAENFLRPSD